MEYIQYIIDFILHIDVHLAELISLYGIWVYGILFVIIFCETGLVVTPFLPGDSLLFVAGALASLPANNINAHLIVLALIIAAVLGDAVNYTIGRFFGKKLFSNPKSKIFRRSYLDKTHNFFEKYGGKTIILARFVPIIRTFAPFVAGMGRMGYRRFASFNVIGGIVWVSLITYAGYFFGRLEFVQENLKVLLLLIIFISLLPAIVEVVREKYLKRRQD
jgi:membrane-associated protein